MKMSVILFDDWLLKIGWKVRHAGAGCFMICTLIGVSHGFTVSHAIFHDMGVCSLCHYLLLLFLSLLVNLIIYTL